MQKLPHLPSVKSQHKQAQVWFNQKMDWRWAGVEGMGEIRISLYQTITQITKHGDQSLAQREALLKLNNTSPPCARPEGDCPITTKPLRPPE